MNHVPRRAATNRSARSPLSTVVLASVACVVLAACGSSSGGGSDGPTAEVDPAAEKLLPADIREKGELAIATDPSYPPCESVDPKTNEIVGFEPDLWHAMGGKLGLEIKEVKVQFDGLIPGLKSGRFPVAMECLSDSKERQQDLDFVDFALSAGSTITLEENPKSISADPLSLCGLKTGTQVGTDFVADIKEDVNDNCTDNGKEPVEISQFPSNDATLLALYSGRIDFVVQDSFGAALLLDTAPKPVAVFDNPLVEALYIGVAVKKGNDELRDAILAALTSLFEDGTYEKVMTEWEIPESAWLEAPGVNLATEKPLPKPTP